MKSVQMRSFFLFVFSCTRTEYRDLNLRILSKNTKNGPEKNQYFDTFHAVEEIEERRYTL